MKYLSILLTFFTTISFDLLKAESSNYTNNQDVASVIDTHKAQQTETIKQSVNNSYLRSVLYYGKKIALFAFIFYAGVNAGVMYRNISFNYKLISDPNFINDLLALKMKFETQLKKS